MPTIKNNVEINEENFPDSSFRSSVALDFDENNDNDVIDIVSIEGGALTGVTTANNHVVFKFGDNDSLTVKDAVDNMFMFNDGDKEYYARVGKNEVTFKNTDDGTGQYYYAAGDNATLKISSGLSNIDTINLGGSSGKYTIGGGVTILDATDADSGLNLVGNTSNNTIVASNQGSTLYGGSGKATDDVLRGGAGEDTFKYASGNGNDVIENAGSGNGNDVIYLVGILQRRAKNIYLTSESETQAVLQIGSSTLTIKIIKTLSRRHFANAIPTRHATIPKINFIT